MKNWKKMLIIPPVILGIIFFSVMLKTKTSPRQTTAKERIRTVRVIKAPVMDVMPRVIGYGYVEPGQSWEGVAEVGGRVIEMHKELKKGYFVKKGHVLVKLDPMTYGLAENRGKADVMSIDARLKELEQSRKNTIRLLATEKKSLKLSARELERKRKLLKKGYISKSGLEKEEKYYLAQQSSVNNLNNTLDLIPAQKKALLAQKSAGISTLTDYQLNLSKTEIYAPFDCRISAVNVEMNQYAGAGMVLVAVESIDTAEIPVKISPRSFSKLLPRVKNVIDLSQMDMNTIRKAIGISAVIRLPFFKNDVFWQGRFSRTSESLDMSTGALTVYVAVDDPYAKVVPGSKPPLMKNMYCEVELRGRPVPDRVVIPGLALHDDTVYMVDKDNRLEIRSVTIALLQGDIAVVEKGVGPGDLIVVTDLSPAVSGMLLKPVNDTMLLSEIKKNASGEGKSK